MWRGGTLLDHTLVLWSSVTEEVSVVGRPPLHDIVPNQGPLGGIATALQTSDTDANLVVAVDLPYLTPEFLRFFSARIESSAHPVVACRVGDRFPLCLGVSKAVLEILHQRLSSGDASIHRFVEAAGPDVISETDLAAAGFDAGIFKNINTPEDLKTAP